MATPPPLQLNQVEYQYGSPWTLALNWTPTQQTGSTYWVQMQAFDSQALANPVGSPVSPTAPNASGGTWSEQAAGTTLSSSTIYWIAVRAVAPQTNPTSMGPWSNALPILFAGAPTLSSAVFDGTGLNVVWTPPVGTNLIGDYQAVIQDASDIVLTTLMVGGQGYPSIDAGKVFQHWNLASVPYALANAPLSLTLTPVYVDPATGAISLGPGAGAGFYAVRPVVVRTVYASGTPATGLSYTVTALQQGYSTGSPPRFLATVYTDGAAVYSVVLATTFGADGNPQGTLALPAEIPFFSGLDGAPPGAALSVSLAQTDGVGTGPAGGAAVLLAAAPLVTRADYAAGTLFVTLDYPPGMPPQAAAQLTVSASSGDGAQGTITGTAGTLSLAAGSLVSYTLTAAAQSGQSLGPPSPSLPLMTAVQALDTASYDGEVVRATWTPPTAGTIPGLLGFRVTATSGGLPVASVTVNDAAAAVAVPAGGEALAVQVALVGLAAQGPPPTAATALISAAPAVASGVTDPVAGSTAVTWPAVTGATGYLVQPYANGAPSGAPQAVASAGWTVTLSPDADQGVAVAATGTSGAAAVTGPYSPVFPLPTGQPELLDVSFNGTDATVAWLPAPGATGHTVSVLQSGAGAPIATQAAPAGATSATVAVTIPDTTRTYTVVVQASFGASSGPPSPALPLFQPGLFLSTDALSTAVPYLYPATTVALGASDLTVYLPDVGGGTALTGLPVTQGAFTLAANAGTGAATFPYTLSIPSGSEAWTFGTTAIRGTLQEDYITFLKACETAGVVPWGVATLQEAISRAMPQTFAETLYYAYGLDLTGGTATPPRLPAADLRPGVVLRVTYDTYMNVPGNPTPQWIPGFAGGASLDYEVGSYLGAAGWAVGFDAFVAQLVASGVMTVQAPPQSVPQQTQAGMADAADLFYPAFVKPFYRLFFPSDLPSPNGVGSTFTPASFVLAAAPSWTALAAAQPYPATGNPVAYFRGRAVVRLGIRVWINGMDEVVPVGTTVGNVLDRYARRPPVAGVALSGVTLERAQGPGVTDPTAPYDPGASQAVRLDWNAMTVYDAATGLTPTSLPLLHGDRLSF